MIKSNLSKPTGTELKSVPAISVRGEYSKIGVSQNRRQSEPVHIKKILPGVMRDIENRIKQNRSQDEG